MWIVRWVTALAVFSVALLFIWYNSEQLSNIIPIRIWRGYQINTPLFVTLFVVFIFGALAWFPVAITQYLKTKAEVRKLKRDNHQLQSELRDLRNISIDEEENKEEEPEKE
ncbi:LapA family protein [candidate division KSB1 bacterium]|nr:LapA family protein [candidate division KSB1 bacterium]